MATPGGFSIANITAPDQFGSDGSGLPDFVSDDFVRVVGINNSEGTNLYAFSEFFRIEQGRTVPIGQLTFTDRPPRQAEEIEILLPTRTLPAGTSNQLQVIARYADGTTNDVSRQRDWTTYRISNTNIAVVTVDGLLVTKRTGRVVVTAINESATTTLALNITEASAGLVTLRGQVLEADGNPAAKVTISLGGVVADSTETDTDGRFHFQGLPPDVGLISLSAWRPDVSGGWFQDVRGVDLMQSGPEFVLAPLTLQRLVVESRNPRLFAALEESFALDPAGKLYAWGNNSLRQLGLVEDHPWAVPTPTFNAFAWRSAGPHIGLRGDGTVWNWGTRGLSDFFNEILAEGTQWNALSARLQLVAGIRNDGTAWVFAGEPSQIGNFVEARWTHLSAGLRHLMALRDDGSLWAWGSGFGGALGLGDFDARRELTQVMPGSRWKDISAGNAFTLAIQADGSLWAWGSNGRGQLADGTRLNRSRPVQVASGTENTQWLAVSAGFEHAMAIRADGTLWGWGHNVFGQLGEGTTLNQYYATEVWPGTRWRAVSAGGYHTLAMQADGSVWSWGSNVDGQLGVGVLTGEVGAYVGGQVRREPIRVQTQARWRSISAGDQHSLAIRSDQTLWGWGENLDGQVGDGRGTRQGPESDPRLASVLVDGGTRWSQTAAGVTGTLGIRTDGTLWYWGDNSYGHLGVRPQFDDSGFAISPRVPAAVMEGRKWRKVAIGRAHAVGIDSGQVLWSWGDNRSGQLGRFPGNLEPAPVLATNRWLDVDADAYGTFTIGIQTNGSLWAWGGNSAGQLGDGTTTQRNFPVPVSPGTRWRSVAAGGTRALGIREDGSLWAWGNNNFGQLGDGTTVNRLVPVPILPELRWLAAATSGSHTLAIREDGTLWTWGNNFSGQLGDGSSVNRSTPSQILPTIRWTAVAAGSSHSIALDTNGSIWAWGANHYSQLGFGNRHRVIGLPPLP